MLQIGAVSLEKSDRRGDGHLWAFGKVVPPVAKFVGVLNLLHASKVIFVMGNVKLWATR